MSEQTLELRDYQREAVASFFHVRKKGYKKIVIQAATGAGKSLIIAGVIKELLAREPNSRVLVLCFTGELLLQNEDKINSLVPHIYTGVYCAMTGRKETTQQVILASNLSLCRDPTVCGNFDLIIVDEAHCVAEDAVKPRSSYGKIFSALKTETILGLTATPYRLKGGYIYESNLAV